jgi:hypothetical protein
MPKRSPEEIRRLMIEARARAQNVRSSTPWFWLSFSDGGFLGANIVQGEDMAAAAARSHLLGINPGGQVVGMPIDDVDKFPAEFRNRLLSKDEVMTKLKGRVMRW